MNTPLNETLRCSQGLARLLPAYASGELDETRRARVAAHLDRCEACRQELAILTEMNTLLRDFAPRAALPAPDLWNRVRAEILTEDGGEREFQRRSSRWRFPFMPRPWFPAGRGYGLAGGVVAAGILLAVVVRFGGNPAATVSTDALQARVASPAAVAPAAPLTKASAPAAEPSFAQQRENAVKALDLAPRPADDSGEEAFTPRRARRGAAAVVAKAAPSPRHTKRIFSRPILVASAQPGALHRSAQAKHAFVTADDPGNASAPSPNSPENVSPLAAEKTAASAYPFIASAVPLPGGTGAPEKIALAATPKPEVSDSAYSPSADAASAGARTDHRPGALSPGARSGEVRVAFVPPTALLRAGDRTGREASVPPAGATVSDFSERMRFQQSLFNYGAN